MATSVSAPTSRARTDGTSADLGEHPGVVPPERRGACLPLGMAHENPASGSSCATRSSGRIDGEAQARDRMETGRDQGAAFVSFPSARQGDLDGQDCCSHVRRPKRVGAGGRRRAPRRVGHLRRIAIRTASVRAPARPGQLPTADGARSTISPQSAGGGRGQSARSRRVWPDRRPDLRRRRTPPLPRADAQAGRPERFGLRYERRLEGLLVQRPAH